MLQVLQGDTHWLQLPEMSKYPFRHAEQLVPMQVAQLLGQAMQRLPPKPV
jgi:hypothetical protein